MKEKGEKTQHQQNKCGIEKCSEILTVPQATKETVVCCLRKDRKKALFFFWPQKDTFLLVQRAEAKGRTGQ